MNAEEMLVFHMSLFQEILDDEIERNEAMKDSRHSLFANSYSVVFGYALEKFQKTLVEKESEFIVKGVNSGFNG